ncbi:MAG TPA: glycosyltransferase family 39 protein [Solirubrobacteraceae bacterium]|nr:glycosyltransferase family 39 protein [Solirubrobacteraceae bacterium]
MAPGASALPAARKPHSAGARADAAEAPRSGAGARALVARIPRPELLALMVLAGVLNLWSLSRNGWANEYYAAAVRSMSSSWHDFLFASLDKGGVMTVDKPPLALWIEALSVRVFGYHSLSVLVPQALMGVASVALVYDLVRRRFGRGGGFVAGLALALTPITVAISRHNNPDALLVLCCVAALWCTGRAFDAAPERSATRWLVAAGVLVGLGFETKMLVALVVVPGITAAWLWAGPAARGRLHALRQLLAGGSAMALVGGAWPLLVEFTPAADRPWISGTSDNRVLSLIFEYNGLGRVDGQAGGPAGAAGPGGAGNVFGGSSGPLRLLNPALGGQAGWLLGFALVSSLGILVASRLRRTDARSGWLLAVGGAFATAAVLFSFAGGIFHPYYVSLLAPFAAALVGAGAAQLIGGSVNTRIVGPLAVVAGVVTELIIMGDYPGQLPWLEPLLIVVGVLTVIVLVAFGSRTVRTVAVGTAVAALLAAPSVWAFDTLGHATSGTFPAGGPTSAETVGFGGPGGGGGIRGGFGGAGRGAFGGGSRGGFGGAAGSGARPTGAGTIPGAAGPAVGVPGAAAGAVGLPGSGFAGGAGGRAGPGAGGAFGGAGSLTSALSYISVHGGGTLAVSSQSTAASAIIAGHTNVAGIGGFSGRESDPSVSWLAQEVREGKIRWVLAEQSGGFGGNTPGETRVGSKPAMAAAVKACQAVTLSTRASTGTGTFGAASATSTSTAASAGKLYDCQGDAAALAALGTQQSHS